LEINEGNYSYNFSLQLPLTLPYSIESKFGYIRYKIESRITTTEAKRDLFCRKVFSVARIEDLNLYADLRLSSEAEVIKTFCCCWCISKPISIKLLTPKTGYAKGERISVTAQIVNDSNVNISKCLMVFKRLESFQALATDAINFSSDHILKSYTLEGLKANDSIQFEKFFDVFQSLSPTSQRHCKIYQISYEIHFLAQVSGCHQSPHVVLPITIGTIPLRSSISSAASTRGGTSIGHGGYH